MEDETAYNQLALYTLTHPSPEFVHQYVVDAFAAQHPHAHTKPITLWFALAGLYLHIEKGFTGRQVQQIHVQMAASKPASWPIFDQPTSLGTVTVHDVLACSEGNERDKGIQEWCTSVWNAWDASHDRIAALLKADLGV